MYKHRAFVIGDRNPIRVRGPLTGLLLGIAVVGVFAPTRVAHAIDAYITADNAYSFGYGPVSGPTQLYGGIENCSSGEIFSCGIPGPETYLSIPAAANAYLYVVAYSDDSVSEGVLGRFVNGSLTTTTGDAAWQVYATGINLNPHCGGGSNAPTLATIQAQIAIANAGQGGAGSSVGWVGVAGGAPGTLGRLAVGESNDAAGGQSCSTPANVFGQVCVSIMGTTPKWMWYNPDPSVYTNPFCGSVPGEFLIFRLLECGADASPCDDGDPCTQSGTCQSGTCVGSGSAPNGTACNDGNVCTQTDTCQSGSCLGSGSAPNGTACVDTNACTQSDTCQSGVCVGSNPTVCTAIDQCHLAGSCNTGTGICSNPNASNGITCNDGSACTQADQCQSGTCVGTYTCVGSIPALSLPATAVLVLLMAAGLTVWTLRQRTS